ncbi:MAG: hypothetical protein R6V38_12015, partial [Roseovarius gahaiensis]
MSLFITKISALPDPSEAGLNSRYGNVIDHCTTLSEQFLRILSKQKEDTVRAGLRFYFDPEKKWQERTSIYLGITSKKNQAEEQFIQNLLFSGPLSSLFIPAESDDCL